MSEMKRLIWVGMMASCVLTSVFLYRKSPTLKIGKVNLQSLLKEEAQRLSRRGLSSDEEGKALKHSLSDLNMILRAFPSNMVLLDASAVISSQVPDMTQNIRKKLAAAQRQKIKS